jgi:predicted RNA-binding protein with PIN domain
VTGSLPEAVRQRVVALAADGLGRMPTEELPPALKRVAAFAPMRRVRAAGNQIATVVETDEVFRGRLAEQVRAASPELVDAVEAGRVPPAADPVEVGAVAYLVRPEGWAGLLAQVSEAMQLEVASAQERRDAELVGRLRDEVDQLRHEALDQRARSKSQAERLKAENAELRRKLGETRARLKEAEEATRAAREEALRDSAQSALDQARTESEARRLRARVAELEDELSTSRRTERARRSGESVRARLLVDTVVEAARGLRRELGLPAVDRLPADSVEAPTAEPGVRTSTGHGSLAVDDPGLLEEVLRLPRAHLVVDGYNITKNTWPDLPLERQRDRLLAGLAGLQARTAAEVTVVFDAADTSNRPVVSAPRGLRVRFSPPGVIADDVIRDLVAAEPPGRPVVVASSDQAVADDVRAAGFRVVAAAALAAVVGGRRPA